jgi:hypothetical protein
LHFRRNQSAYFLFYFCSINRLCTDEINLTILDKCMQIAKWIEFGGIVSSFVGMAIKELAPQLRSWSERYPSSGSPGEGEYSPEDVSEMRYRLSELTGKPVLTENESAELYGLNRILASLPGQASPSSPAVPPAAFPGGYPGGFPPTSVEGPRVATPEQQAQIDSLRRLGLI